MEDSAFEVGRRVRDALMVIPNRLSALLAAEQDRHKVHEMLEKEIRQALEYLSSGSGLGENEQ